MYVEIQLPFILFYVYQTLEGSPSVQLLFEEISVLKGHFHEQNVLYTDIYCLLYYYTKNVMQLFVNRICPKTN